ncbi:MAG: hypothetical protein NTV79_02000 [Candidatus Aureabacteria bacterium]|nr:hypothetical protein [Candidatus Auribacterota bacterium]
MKILSREFWGTVLIFLGVVLFLAVLYDSVRPFFPNAVQDETAQKIVNAVVSLFKRGAAATPPAEQPPAGQPPSDQPPPEQPPPAAQPPPPPPPPLRTDGFLTDNIYQTKGDYFLWVWEVLPGKKRGDKVKVEIAHPVAGENGAFEIVAFADTDGDGKPDKEIARSEELSAENPGDWSSLEFTTPEKRIFVGYAWTDRSGVYIYRGNGGWPLPDSPFDNRFYYSVAGADSQSAGPAFTNLKVSFPD